MPFVPTVLRALAAALLLLCVGCAQLPTGFSRTPSYAVFDTGGTRIGQVVEPLVAGHSTENGTYVLFNGLEAFAARWSLIQAAERTLDLQYYIWHPDTSGSLIVQALWNAAERGVRVRILLDDANTGGLDVAIAAMNAHPNIEVRLFNPFVHRTFRIADFVADFGRVHRRMHNKSFTADNQVTVVGGRNIGDEYLGGETSVAFMDMDAMVMGTVVREVSADFDEYWNSESSYPVHVLFRPFSEQELLEARQQWERLGAVPQAQRYLQAAASLKLLQQMRAGTLPLTWSTAYLWSDDPAKVLNSADRKDLTLMRQLEAKFGNPRTELQLVSPYFVPGRAMTDLLVGFVARGIQVSVLTNSLAATDVAPVYAGYLRYRDDLLRGGVRLFELKPAAQTPGLSDQEDEVRLRGVFGSRGGSSGASLHAKTFAVDRDRIFVGSFNLDPRSATLNTELGLVFESPVLANRLATIFDVDVLNEAYELRMAENGRVTWIERTAAGEVRHTSTPGASAFRSLWIGLLSLFPIEGLL
jgi:putative cardiolipin synthase